MWISYDLLPKMIKVIDGISARLRLVIQQDRIARGPDNSLKLLHQCVIMELSLQSPVACATLYHFILNWSQLDAIVMESFRVPYDFESGWLSIKLNFPYYSIDPVVPLSLPTHYMTDMDLTRALTDG
jgi:hypothetical protein